LPRNSRYTLRMPEDLANLIRGLHPSLKKKVSASLEAILSNPTSGKALKDDLAGLRSFRIGRLRIIYRISRIGIQVIAIGPRSRIYQDTLRFVKRGEEQRDKPSQH
jgi:mRNA-degrading endonuclease RelE of RelBE toxin-antitoxin system